MKKKLLTAAMATVALVATPVLAQSDYAQRAAAQVQDAEELGEGGGVIALLAGGLIIAGAVVALTSIEDGDDDDDALLPTSP
ncbi:hypothetical protein [Aurantiacibacter poecillastricola]|uniref:hypothetical protein n=1 Tax=Aurantiacibacter poecillastricola TaxID=3064385 RepID=UPI00273F82E7|nr:hypothetical protein [Aurantiacibacter sp. 219JJ12-13]MDP5262846.1 hypothetical protein [Aurantiacibacter sp. 219JJ12-13]